jgi:hypothetical protein
LTEGTDLDATDATLGDVTATLTVGAVRTDISDLAQRQAAVNLAEVIGIAHGNSLNRFMNNDIYSTLENDVANATCKVTGGTANNSYCFTFNDIMYVKGLVEKQRGRADTFVTYPYQAAVGSGNATGFYPFVMGNISSVQFTTAMAAYVASGQISELFGLKLYVDKVYEPSNAAVANARLGSVLVSGETEGWAQAEDIISEIQRWAPQVGFRIVTHVTGKSARVMEPWVGHIVHA